MLWKAIAGRSCWGRHEQKIPRDAPEARIKPYRPQESRHGRSTRVRLKGTMTHPVIPNFRPRPYPFG